MTWAVTGVSVGLSIMSSASASSAKKEQAYAQRAHERRINERKDRAQWEAWMDQADDHGTQQAAADFNHARALALLPQKAQSLNEEAQASSIDAQYQTAAAKADAVVQANASGSAGASVDQSVQTVDDGVARVKAAIEKNRRNSMMGIGQEYEDLFWARENKKKELKLTGQISNYDTGSIKSDGVDWLGAAATGVSTWAANR